MSLSLAWHRDLGQLGRVDTDSQGTAGPGAHTPIVQMGLEFENALDIVRDWGNFTPMADPAVANGRERVAQRGGGSLRFCALSGVPSTSQ